MMKKLTVRQILYIFVIVNATVPHRDRVGYKVDLAIALRYRSLSYNL